MPQPPAITPTPDAAVGMQCPYCQTPMAAGESATTCGDCTTVHHEECWAENQGCAVPGCASAPDPLAVVSAATATIAATATATGELPRLAIPVEDVPRRGIGRQPASAPVPAGLQGAPRKRSKAPWVVAAAVALLVVGAGALVATAPDERPTAGGQADCEGQTCAAGGALGTPHELSEAAIASSVQTVVRNYYAALRQNTAEGRDTAYDLLSDRTKTYLETDGPAKEDWDRDAAQIGADLLRPRAASVTVLNGETSQESTIARVRVGQMGWNGRGCANGRFDGVMWATHLGSTTSRTWRLEPIIDAQPDRQLSAGEYLVGERCLAPAPR